MFSVSGRKRIVTGGNGVFAADLAVSTHRREFAAALALQHFSRCFLRFTLSIVNAPSAIRIVAFVCPFTVAGGVYASTCRIAHVGLSLSAGLG